MRLLVVAAALAASLLGSPAIANSQPRFAVGWTVGLNDPRAGAAEGAATQGTADDPAPESDKSIGKRWKEFIAATRGLVTWDFFGGRLTVRAGMRFQVDGTVMDESTRFEQTYGSFDSTIDLRRLRLFAEGTIDKRLRYKVQYQFFTDSGFESVYVEGIHKGLKAWGYNLGKFRVGQFQEPFSLEQQEGNHDIAFLERSLPVWAIAPGDNIGYMLHNTTNDQRVAWAVGFFSFGAKREGNASASSFSISSRVTGLPMYRDEGRKLFHVGASVSVRSPRSSTVRYKSRPEARFVTNLVDTGDIPSSSINLYGLEFAGMSGPLWYQGEWILSSVSSTETGNPDFGGAYAQVGYFLSGEIRDYKRERGTFGRIVPLRNYKKGLPLCKKNGGAFEVAARLSTLDLNDGVVRGGELTNFSVAFNWYPNAVSMLMFDYVQSHVQDNGTAHILLVRYGYNPW